ncbi:MAG: hypothetical protein OEY60_03310 [Nitrospira sp.]|nr:hypothetical protein [Nitrospira sp.]
MIDSSIRRCKKSVIHGDHTIAVRNRGLLLFFLIISVTSGCASPESLEMGSYDPSHDQRAIAGYYRHQALAMHEKAKAQTTTAARYEELFGAESDLVSGARLLAHYYEETALELERLAKAHASVDRTGRGPTAVP